MVKSDSARTFRPGFAIAKKDDDDRYGDLIVWKQILDFAVDAAPKALVFVTDDGKDDWWLRQGGRTLGPHPGLVEEFASVAPNVPFHMYSGEQVLRFARQHLRAQVAARTVEEVGQVSRVRREVDDWFTAQARSTAAEDAQRRLPSAIPRLRGRSSDRLQHRLTGLGSNVFVDHQQFIDGAVTEHENAMNTQLSSFISEVASKHVPLHRARYGVDWVLENTATGEALSADGSATLKVSDMRVAPGNTLRIRLKNGDVLEPLPSRIG
jgi:hypothetical protein